LKPTPEQAGELRQFLHGFLIFYLERLPKAAARRWQMKPNLED